MQINTQAQLNSHHLTSPCDYNAHRGSIPIDCESLVFPYYEQFSSPVSLSLSPGDFDKRANEVVKYDQELNVNEKSTSNEMVGGDAFSWRQQQRHLGVLLGSVLVTVVAVFRLRWLY